MGTEFKLYLSSADEIQAQACYLAAFEEIERIEQAFSRFRDSSEVSRINRLAFNGPMVTDPEVFQLISRAMDISRKTGGFFDVTVGSLTRVWGFAEHQRRIPEPQALAEARESVGWQKVVLDPAWRTVQFLQAGIELDLGAIAKGYAVDSVMEVLRRIGVPALMDAGSSSMMANDAELFRDWKVAIPNPLNRALPLWDVKLGNRALSTSGVMEQSFVQDGCIYSHLIHPVGQSAPPSASGQQLLQVTVLAPDSTLADALSTAMFLLGHEQGSQSLQQFPECSALWVYSDANGLIPRAHQWPEDENLCNKGVFHGKA
jgi:thiamine biosynthesis lipoprotein